jgi:hypothetical protein
MRRVPVCIDLCHASSALFGRLWNQYPGIQVRTNLYYAADSGNGGEGVQGWDRSPRFELHEDVFG